jgi:hypothetical protein
MSKDPEEFTEWEFVVRINGLGDTQEEAWQDAVEQFSQDPGEPHEARKAD